jgi:hypothetical protein
MVGSYLQTGMQGRDQISAGIYPLFNLEKDRLKKTLLELDGYWKTCSIVYIDQLGLPTLPAIAITTWSQNVKENLTRILKEKNWSSVVIRTDKKKETGENIPRGGYLIEISKLEDEIKHFLNAGRLIMILEPRDKYRNLYGINISYEDTFPDTFYLEVVGPGFEVSNLNRGDISPHERLRIKRVSEDIDIMEKSVISPAEYKKSIYYRLLHLGKFLVSKQKLAANSEAELVEIAKQFLKNNGYDLLFKHENVYPEIPKKYLTKIKNFIAPLPQKMTELGLDVNEFIISSTIYDTEELVFWDIVWPTRKYGEYHG